MKRIPSRRLLGFLFLVLALAVCPLVSFAQAPGFKITLLLPAPPSINISGTTISRVIVLPANGFTGMVNFTCTVTGPVSLPCMAPPTITIKNPLGDSTVATVTVGNTVPAGTYTITVNASSGTIVPSDGAQSVPLTVTRNYGVGCGSVSPLILAGLLTLWGATWLWRKGHSSAVISHISGNGVFVCLAQFNTNAVI